MLRYEDIKYNERRLQSLTSLKRGEFAYLLRYFWPLCERYFRHHTYQGKRRKALRHKPQSDEKLPTSEDKLFFLLVYLKANPLQEFQGPSSSCPRARFRVWSSACRRCWTKP